MPTDTPPVCDYTGSDYQVRFWDQADRAYEDAVEAVALRRLLPASGDLLIELGAGAGRNTRRYTGYKQVVLVDYSRTQLEQAQVRLGNGPEFIYVAADVYRLPFVDGLFDGATMIRTLHHLSDAPLALGQVRRVLRGGGTFILEYASKLNLKAILRYLLRLQRWSPFSPEPVEFAKLNFDFHPASIRKITRGLGFKTERQLTVSHLRAGIFKRLLPLRWMVALDSAFQLTGDLWQLTPSVFMKMKAGGSEAGARPSVFFQCPACGSDAFTEHPDRILCSGCHRNYDKSGGIYDFRIDHG